MRRDPRQSTISAPSSGRRASVLVPLAVALATAVAGACGAPNKSAGDVANLFEGAPVTLQSKVSSLCDTLTKRADPPNLAGINLQLNGCNDAGLAALNYRDLTAFQFLGIDGDVPAADKTKVIEKTVRAQIWLNRSLLAFASALGAKLQASAGGTGLIAPPDSGKALANIIKTELTQTQPLHFDAEKFEVSGQLNVKASGIAEVDNDIVIAGKLIDGAFAVTLKTTEDADLKKSLIKSVSGVVLIVPHAGDIYMDLYVDLQVNNIGLAGLFRQVIAGLLSDNLKKMADGLLNI
jgi:hypothetical protein